ncbi:MAG: flagellar hook-associated protein FlgL [Spongiibacteraceae bacterium]
MAVRTSFLQSFNSGVQGILRLQQQTFKTQEQVATGRRITTPADDPVASARVVQVNQELSQLGLYVKNADAAESRLGLEENQVQQVSNILVRVKEITVRAGGVGLTQSERQGLAAELDSRLGELLDLANTRDVNGEYIFAGYQGEVAPFELSSTGQYVYHGDDGQRMVKIASSTLLPVNDSGQSIFVDIKTDQKLIGASEEEGNSSATAITASSLDNTIDASDGMTNYERTGSLDDYIVRYETIADGFSADGYNIYSRSDLFDDGVLSSPINASVIPHTGSPMTIDANTIDPTPGSPDTTNLGWSITLTGTPDSGDQFYVDSRQTQDVLTTIAKLSEGLKNLTDSPEDSLIRSKLLADSLDNLTYAETNMSRIIAQIGARQNTLDSVRDLHEGVKLVNEQVLSELRDIDYAEALTRLTNETFALEAAQQSYVKVSGLSLFNFL